MSEQEVAQVKQEQNNNNINNELLEAETVKIDEVTTELVSEPIAFVEQFESPKAMTKPVLVVDRSMPELAQLSQSNR